MSNETTRAVGLALIVAAPFGYALLIFFALVAAGRLLRSQINNEHGMKLLCHSDLLRQHQVESQRLALRVARVERHLSEGKVAPNSPTSDDISQDPETVEYPMSGALPSERDLQLSEPSPKDIKDHEAAKIQPELVGKLVRSQLMIFDSSDERDSDTIVVATKRNVGRPRKTFPKNVKAVSWAPSLGNDTSVDGTEPGRVPTSVRKSTRRASNTNLAF